MPSQRDQSCRPGRLYPLACRGLYSFLPLDRQAGCRSVHSPPARMLEEFAKRLACDPGDRASRGKLFLTVVRKEIFHELDRCR
jgi:hypothetical protein